MRPLLKSVMGGALALLLIVSASPAQAFDSPTDDETTTLNQGEEQQPEAPVEEPATETPEETVPGEEAPAEGEPADPSAEVPAEEPAVEVVEELQPEPNPGDFTEVPESIALNGTIIVLPDEPNAEDHAAGTGSGGALISTEAGVLVPVNETAFGAALIPNAEFAGSAALPESAKAAIAAKLTEDGSLSEVDLLSTVTDALAPEGETLAAAGEVAAAPVADVTEDAEGRVVAGAPAKKAHTADVVYLTGTTTSNNNRPFTEAQLKSLVTQSGTYWNTQSNGAIPSISVNKYKKADMGGSNHPCYQDGLWNFAAKQLGTNINSTYKNGKHLIVFVDTKYGCQGLAGLAGIGDNIHAGGVIWVDLASYGGTSGSTQAVVNKSLSTLSHEIGHNLSLGHAQSRVCTGNTVDATTAFYDDEQNVGVLKVRKPATGSGCRDAEYGDTWSLMGAGSYAAAKPSALGLAQRTALGVSPAGSVTTVKAAAGRGAQTFTLNPLGSTSGVRGLRIQNPAGEEIYVEYRSATGQDSTVLGGNSYIQSWDGTTRVSNGLLVTKNYPSGLIRWSDGSWRSYPVKRSTALTYKNTNGAKYLNIGQNNGVTTPIKSVAKVQLVSTAGGKAQVRVIFSRYSDVDFSFTHYQGIEWMAAKGYVQSGSNAQKYNPNSATTRGAFATMLMRMKQPNSGSWKPSQKTVKNWPFKDVKPTDTHYKGIAWMYEKGYAAKGAKYNPGSPVTRGAMATFMQRMEAKTYQPPASLKMPYQDVKKTDTHYKGIAWMYQKGYAASAAKYNGSSSTTRGAMATFLWRIYK